LWLRVLRDSLQRAFGSGRLLVDIGRFLPDNMESIPCNRFALIFRSRLAVIITLDKMEEKILTLEEFFGSLEESVSNKMQANFEEWLKSGTEKAMAMELS
jgi:hypothetical protein